MKAAGLPLDVVAYLPHKSYTRSTPQKRGQPGTILAPTSTRGKVRSASSPRVANCSSSASAPSPSASRGQRSLALSHHGDHAIPLVVEDTLERPGRVAPKVNPDLVYGAHDEGMDV